MKVTKGSIWKCVDEDDGHYDRLCVVKHVDNNPDFNGEGPIELLYADGTRHYGKVRRFMPGTTHQLVKESTQIRSNVFPSDALSSMEAEVIRQLHLKLLSVDENTNHVSGLDWKYLNINISRPLIAIQLAAEEVRYKMQKEV